MMTAFKVLTFGAIDELNQSFVNESMLRKGIYNTSIPILHENTLTILKMKKNWKYLLKTLGEESQVINSILSNLDKCQLTEVDLILI